ncbi:ATP-binding SpoIIE family protein phosphatase [Deinococcus pimensis]|uniref:ATP-binding SpoIIE family protein phosphatase n=1 Tax=Deinococcus pimensis TaxID=309888 RepID=UPI000487EB28|nr:ATP-binding SpoIIE family protein phosphatase [Deinococcus pimensis]
MRAGLRFVIREASGVGEARRASVDLARSLGLNDVRQGEVALVVTELGTNLVKHAGEGELLVRPVEGGARPAVEVLALDRGPGVARVGEVLRDGYSTAGTPGTGLGAVRRLSRRFDLYSQPGQGAAVLATVGGEGGGPFDIGVVQVPHPRETVCGDGFAVHARDDRLAVMVVDGLGHGVGGRDAASAAVSAFLAEAAEGPPELLAAVHRGMRGRGGGVAGVALLDRARREVTFSGMGNVSGTVVTPAGRRGLVSQDGTLGLTPPKPTAQTLPWTPGDLLVLHSDGLGSLWSLDRSPGLAGRSCALVAGVLYRDHARGRDDVTVLVVKETP